jgi:hypothetical protein
MRSRFSGRGSAKKAVAPWIQGSSAPVARSFKEWIQSFVDRLKIKHRSHPPNPLQHRPILEALFQGQASDQFCSGSTSTLIHR